MRRSEQGGAAHHVASSGACPGTIRKRARPSNVTMRLRDRRAGDRRVKVPCGILPVDRAAAVHRVASSGRRSRRWCPSHSRRRCGTRPGRRPRPARRPCRSGRVSARSVAGPSCQADLGGELVDPNDRVGRARLHRRSGAAARRAGPCRPAPRYSACDPHPLLGHRDLVLVEHERHVAAHRQRRHHQESGEDADPIGRIRRSRPTISRSWLLPGAAQRWRSPTDARGRCSDMRENIDFRPACEIQRGACRQEIEAGLSQRGAALARQAAVELLAQAVEIAHVGRGIFALRVVQLGPAPVGRLLCLGNFLRRAVRAPAPSGRGDRYRCGPAARRSWCNRPGRRSPPDNAGSRRYRSARNDRASAAPDRPAPPSDWARHNRCRDRSAPDARRRRRRISGRRTAGRAG